ncbi:hypothetical protein M407DRAFT_4005 [Tulasnella calospora MUT 4182]|uniref:SH3 domain-containing protein n=1 Tax=Tulasnella calospora MUT 4182 TaxID=1051891 RepID=A0A0C3QVA8_9AGAM|nr:hypothetical protein M407DRAFT_4005 [Tulasnella calospora MUT 4182]
MASGVDELEAFVAALRLSFLTSSSTTGSPESLRQGIEAFRQTLRPTSTFTTSPMPTEAYVQKRDHGHHSAEEPISSASTVWSSDDRIEAVCPSSATQIRAALRASASSTLIREADTDSSPDHCLETTPNTSGSDTWIRFMGGEQLLVPTPSPPVTIQSFTSPSPSRAAELPTLPRMLSRPPSPAPCPVAVSNPIHSQTSAPLDPCSTDVPVMMFPTAGDPKPAMSSAKPQNSPCQPVSDLEGEGEVEKTTENRACDPTHRGNIEAEDVNDPKVSSLAKLHPESPLIAKAVQSYNGPSSEGELSFRVGDQITILDSPSTPVGWMYGERIQTRRGIFLARYIKEMSDPEVKRLLTGDYAAGNFKATERSPDFAATMVSIRQFSGCRSGVLDLRLGDRITILDSPNTPDGWIYGEIAEKGQGIFPAIWESNQGFSESKGSTEGRKE